MIVVCEELVEESVIRADPNRTVIPGVVVDAVVEEPFGCHPSFAQGYYDRDNAFYLQWDEIAREREALKIESEIRDKVQSEIDRKSVV